MGLIVAAALATPSDAGATGGTLRLSKSTDVDYVDPALAYFSDSFGLIGYATCARLYNYPDRAESAGTTIVPEVAAGFPRVSEDGETFTIELKRTYRFHTGAPVTAQSFVDAFNRNAHPRMQSPATQHMRDIRRVRALGRYTLRIETTDPAPDLVARLAMPFFCPILPRTPIEPDGVNDPAGSGPYFVAERVVNRRIVLRRNPFYRGPRPSSFDQIVWTIGPSLEACRLATERNEIDYCVDGLPSVAYKEIAAKYGVNRKNGQFFFNPVLGFSYFALNHDRPAFRNNILLKKAINYAVDRPSLVRASGFLGGIRTDQILPPALGRDVSLYPLKGPDLAKARALAKGHMPPGNKLVLWTANRGAGVIRAQLLQYQLKQIGIHVEIRSRCGRSCLLTCDARGSDFDLCDESWLADYPDGVTFFDPLLNGSNLQATRNTNVSYFDNPDVNRRIWEIEQMTGLARFRAWQKLDVDVMRKYAPIVPFQVITSRDFVSSSVGCYLHHPVWGFDLAAACSR